MISSASPPPIRANLNWWIIAPSFSVITVALITMAVFIHQQNQEIEKLRSLQITPKEIEEIVGKLNDAMEVRIVNSIRSTPAPAPTPYSEEALKAIANDPALQAAHMDNITALSVLATSVGLKLVDAGVSTEKDFVDKFVGGVVEGVGKGVAEGAIDGVRELAKSMGEDFWHSLSAPPSHALTEAQATKIVSAAEEDLVGRFKELVPAPGLTAAAVRQIVSDTNNDLLSHIKELAPPSGLTATETNQIASDVTDDLVKRLREHLPVTGFTDAQAKKIASDIGDDVVARFGELPPPYCIPARRWPSFEHSESWP